MYFFHRFLIIAVIFFFPEIAKLCSPPKLFCLLSVFNGIAFGLPLLTPRLVFIYLSICTKCPVEVKVYFHGIIFKKILIHKLWARLLIIWQINPTYPPKNPLQLFGKWDFKLHGICFELLKYFVYLFKKKCVCVISMMWPCR